MPLTDYRRKRQFSESPEPPGVEGAATAGAAAAGRFVIQQHAARRLHYDLRLEIDGVLRSWAVPKGPTLDPGEKRLAVRTEDHPMEYLTFEAVIPKGNYGAGTMIVWDTGSYRLEEELPAAEQVERGELKFFMEGSKLRGSFVLVRLKPRKGAKEAANDWLLIKHRDDFAEPGWDIEAFPDSALTGRTLEEVRDGLPPDQAAQSLSPASLEGAAPASFPERATPMLATLLDKPFSHPDWLFELKWDGMRALIWIDGDKHRIESRTGRDVTAHYPELNLLSRCLKAQRAILDCELVVLDETGCSSFERMQSRMNAAHPSPAQVEAAPVTAYVFDVLYCDGYQLSAVPLIERKKFLRKILSARPPLRYADHILERGEEMFDLARDSGVEGIIGKQIHSPYVAGRTNYWVKLKIHRELDAVIGGYTAPRGGRSHLGALLVGLYSGKKLEFIGGVGTGFDEARLGSLAEEFKPFETRTCPFREDPQTKEPATWLKPRLVARVRFRELTQENRLRQPVFVALRHDIEPRDCRLEGEIPAAPTIAGPVKVASPPVLRGEAVEEELVSGKAENVLIELDGKVQRLSNLNKVYFPEAAMTKRDLLAHYYRVSSYLLPFLKDRPLVLNRFPNGIHGKSFYQKDAGDDVPAWMDTIQIRSEERRRDIRYLVANDLSGLLYVANLGCIEQHPWSSTGEDPERPDYVFFDLDPTEKTEYATVVRVAREVLKILDAIGLKVFVKTSGASGLHMYLPLERDYGYEHVRTFAEIVARMIVSELPNLATLERLTGKRGEGLVYIDYSQNGYGRPLASPYCVRPHPEASVSAPLARPELKRSLKPSRFTIASMPARLKEKGDLWAGFFDERQRIEDALASLRERYGRRWPA